MCPVILTKQRRKHPPGRGWEGDSCSWDFRKAFDTAPHSIFTDKLSTCGWGGSQRAGEGLAEGQSSKGCSEWGHMCLVAGHQQCSSGSIPGKSCSRFLSVMWMQELNAPFCWWYKLRGAIDSLYWLSWGPRGLAEEFWQIEALGLIHGMKFNKWKCWFCT